MIRRRLLLGLIGYATIVAAVVYGVVDGRRRALETLAAPDARLQWQAWREETERLSRGTGPVVRRAARATEPPLLILLRDHFAAVLTTTLAAVSALYWVGAFFVQGSLRTSSFGRPNETESSAMPDENFSPPPETAPPSNSSTVPRGAAPPPLAWRSWPVVDSTAVFLSLAAVWGAAVLIAHQSSGPLYAAAAAVAVGCAALRHFTPTHFELSALGVVEHGVLRRRRIPWMSIDRYVVGRSGVYLSSAGAPLEMLRGLYLPFGPHREAMLATLRYYLPQAETQENA